MDRQLKSKLKRILGSDTLKESEEFFLCKMLDAMIIGIDISPEQVHVIDEIDDKDSLRK